MAKYKILIKTSAAKELDAIPQKNNDNALLHVFLR